MIDLQLHTTDSDGTWTWEAVLDECKKRKLTAFAITDHDTVVRRDDIRSWAKKKKARAIPGIELSTREKGQTIHLLGYFLDGSLEKLEARLKFLRSARADRNKLIIHKLQSLGIHVTVDDVRIVAGNGTMGRPHIARALMQKGIVKSVREAFDKFLAEGGKAYFPKEELPLREGIDLLHEAGAVTSVAHSILLNRAPEDLSRSLNEWKSWGLDAVEAYYPTYTPSQTNFLVRKSEKYRLLLTGGSDFHGDNKPHINIGVGTGKLNVPDELLEPLLQRRDEILKKAVP